MFCTGVAPLDYILGEVGDGRQLHLAGDEQSPVQAIAAHFLRRAKVPMYFNLSGGLSEDVLLRVARQDVAMVEEWDGDRAMDILRSVTKQGIADLVVVDDVPSIVTQSERDGSGDELNSLEMVGLTMNRIRLDCLHNKVTVLWLNQLRKDEVTGIRLYGKSIIANPATMTIVAQYRRRLLDDSGMDVGHEVQLKVWRGKPQDLHRSTVIGVIDDEVSEGYWRYKERIRKGKIVVQPNGKMNWKGDEYAPWDLIRRWELEGEYESA